VALVRTLCHAFFLPCVAIILSQFSLSYVEAKQKAEHSYEKDHDNPFSGKYWGVDPITSEIKRRAVLKST
jgi:hypothetical protein